MAAATAALAERWAGRGYERGHTRLLWSELLSSVFGMEQPSSFVRCCRLNIACSNVSFRPL